ncbi:nitrous oxide reductase accessory protein NosL [Geobacter sp.]|uniref:nitrous oxide reductase accessory protein NosL n=1 Tax=Geobacter sp. TaxID=46610 RepID=UPI0026087FA8|nr:nitrous oxide reductase accessory protein NosL [Geobacter sp.]
MIKFISGMVLCLVVTAVAAFAMEKVEPPASCQVCGMNRGDFARGRVLITYADGTVVGTCSLHCAAIAMDERSGKKIASIRVADFQSGKLIDAQRAVWVIGSKMKGPMAGVVQLAFAGNQEARAFVKKNGGVVATFEQALKLAGMESTLDDH